jgi:hypothetical protein
MTTPTEQTEVGNAPHCSASMHRQAPRVRSGLAMLTQSRLAAPLIVPALLYAGGAMGLLMGSNQTTPCSSGSVQV